VAAEEEEACHWLLFLPTATKAPPVWERKAPPVWKKKAHFWERKAPVWVTRMWAAGAACHRLPLSSSLPPQPELAMKAPRCCFGELTLHCKRLIVFLFSFACLLRVFSLGVSPLVSVARTMPHSSSSRFLFCFVLFFQLLRLIVVSSFRAPFRVVDFVLFCFVLFAGCLFHC